MLSENKEGMGPILRGNLDPRFLWIRRVQGPRIARIDPSRQGSMVEIRGLG